MDTNTDEMKTPAVNKNYMPIAFFVPTNLVPARNIGVSL